MLALAASLAKDSRGEGRRLARLGGERLERSTQLWMNLSDLRERIEKTIVPEPPLTFSDGGVIARGFDRDLDELRELSRNSNSAGADRAAGARSAPASRRSR